MNNNDKLLSDIAKDVVLDSLRGGIHPGYVYERDDCTDLDESDIGRIYDKATDVLKELAAFFERTIK